MPYKDKEKDRVWHKLRMRGRRLRLKGTIVTPQTITPVQPKPCIGQFMAGIEIGVELDADGNIIPEDE